MLDHELSLMRAQFVLEYLKDFNATQAALRAGYSKGCANSKGSLLLDHPDVIKAINIQVQARAKRTLITADRVLSEIHDIAMADPSEAYNEDGTLKNIKDMPKELRNTISSIETREIFEHDINGDKELVGYTKTIKFWDKSKNLETLCKHLKLLTEDKVAPVTNNNNNVVIKFDKVDLEERQNQLIASRICSTN